MRLPTQTTPLRHAVALAAAGALAAWIPVASAQQEGADQIEEIVVTGSAIKRADLTEALPIQVLEADTVITALPLIPNTAFITAIEAMVPEVYCIGDCNKPGLIKDAIAAGARVGHTI